MPITANTGYYTNPYAQYNSYKAPVANAADQRENEEDQLAAASGSIAAAMQQPTQPVNGDQPQLRAVEAEPEAEGSRQESMDRKNSSVQLDMLDLQAAFFGFSTRRATDIPAVSFEPAVS